MKRLLLSGVLLLVLSTNASAQDLEDIAYQFYSQMTQILKRNMTQPDTCFKEVKNYIERNHAMLKTMQQSVEKNYQSSMEKYQNMGSADLQKAQEMMNSNKTMQAVNQWIEAYMKFAARNPEQAAQIAGLISTFAPSQMTNQ